MLLLALTKVTERENAINLGTLALATVFSREEGLDGAASIEDFKQQAADQPGEVLTPLPDIPAVTINKSDLEDLTPREIRLKIFRQIVEPLYDKGIEGAARDFTSNQQEVESLVNDASLLQVFTKSFHQRINSFFLGGLAISLLLLVGFVFFSFGWGRLGNPGLLLFVIGLPGLLIGLLMKNPPTDGDGGPFNYIPPEVAAELGQQLMVSYGVSVAIGAVLLIAALVGAIVARHRRVV
jgi:hypothetical protein